MHTPVLMDADNQEKRRPLCLEAQKIKKKRGRQLCLGSQLIGKNSISTHGRTRQMHTRAFWYIAECTSTAAYSSVLLKHCTMASLQKLMCYYCR